MRRRTLVALLVVLVLASAGVVVVLLRRAAPPEPARLLPAADAFVYFNLKPLRAAKLLRETPAVKLDPDYEKFIRQTGFQFERDLDEVAFAAHYPQPGQPTGQRPPEARFSEVFAARFDWVRVTNYLRSISSSVEKYRDVEIFFIPLPGRTLRVAILGPSLVGASNQDDPGVIRGIIDRSKQLARPFAGPELLRKYHRRVPLGSVAWAIARLGAAGETNPMYTLPGGLSVSVPAAAVAVASLRYTGAVQLRASVFTQNAAEAQRIADQLSLVLGMFRSIEANAQPGGPDPDVKAFFDSLKVERHNDRAELTAVVPQGFVKKLMSEPPPLAPPAPQSPPEQKKKAGKAK